MAGGVDHVVGAPDVLVGCGALTLSAELQARLATEADGGRRVVAFGEAAGGLPSDPASQPPPRLEPRALVVLEETLRPDAAETIEFMREQYLATGTAPSIRALGKESGVAIKELYELFPKGPAKLAAKIGGIPKPRGCI